MPILFLIFLFLPQSGNAHDIYKEEMVRKTPELQNCAGKVYVRFGKGRRSGIKESVTPQIDPRKLSSFLTTRQHKYLHCVAVECKKSPKIKGTIYLKFATDKNGVVGKIEIDKENSTLKNWKVAQCFADRVKESNLFSLTMGKEVVFHYPIQVANGW